MGQREVLAYLSDHDGEWVSFDELRRGTGVSPTAMHIVMKKLVKEGLVEVTREFADRPGEDDRLMVIYWYRRWKERWAADTAYRRGTERYGMS